MRRDAPASNLDVRRQFVRKDARQLSGMVECVISERDVNVRFDS